MNASKFFARLATALVCPLGFALDEPAAPIDLDNNRLDDVWEARYDAEDLAADGDADGDGQSNLAESLAGTDPSDPRSRFHVTRFRAEGRGVKLTWPSVVGKAYRFSLSRDLRGWEHDPAAHPGTGYPLTLELSRAEDSLLVGAVLREVWLGVPGTGVKALTDLRAFPELPNGTHAVGALECPENYGEDFGARLRGYLIPAASGEYAFALETRDAAELWLSTDHDPANAEKIAQFPNLTAEPGPVAIGQIDADAGGAAGEPVDAAVLPNGRVRLEAGKIYYIEVLHKAGEGDDFCRVLWVPPGASERHAVPGENLAAWVGRPAGAGDFPRAFCKVSVIDCDQDGDGATDYEESLVNFDPFVADSAQSGKRDGQVLSEWISAPPSASVAAGVGDGFEEDIAGEQPVPGSFKVVRTGGLGEVTAAYAVSGTAVEGADYAALPRAVTLGFGEAEKVIEVTPVADGDLEIPETVLITSDPPVREIDAGEGIGALISPYPDLGKATITLQDYEDMREILFAAQMGPENGAATSATGFSTLRLSGDHLSCVINVSFSGLTSLETAKHVHWANPDSGPIIESLPPGQVVDHLWAFPPEGQGPLASQQAILDALSDGRLYANVHSAIYPAGEIRGDYLKVEGSIDFVPPDDPPEIPDYTGDDETRDHLRLLTQATFGPTPEELAAVEAQGIEGWIDAQMAMPPISLMQYTAAADGWEIAWNEALGDAGDPAYNPNFEPNFHNRRRGWWLMASQAPDQLRQRVAFALSEIFVASRVGNATVSSRHYGLADFYDRLGQHAFGNFRDLLYDVSLHPIMGNYLSMIKNEKANPALGTSPDENYAREIMQLFSTGLLELWPDGTLRLDPETGLPSQTYDNADITELARIFTGWSYGKREDSPGAITDNNSFFYGGGAKYLQAAFYHPMKMFDAYHDFGSKTIIGGTEVPAGLSGDADMAFAVDTLFNHPNTGPFIARRLIQRLVTSNPSRGYVYRAAAVFDNDGSGQRGNLGAVVKAILTDYEARSQEINAGVGFGKQREPIIRFVSLLRAFGAASRLPLADFDAFGFDSSPFSATATRLRFPLTDAWLGQTPQNQPSVFNWFLPDYVSPGDIADAGLVAPEFQITTETTVVQNTNYHYLLTFGSNGLSVGNVAGLDANADNVRLNLSAAQAVLDDHLAANPGDDAGAAAALADFLNWRLAAGMLGTESLETIAGAIEATSSPQKVQTGIYLAMSAPEFLIQR